MTQKAETAVLPADVIWAIDNSDSMKEEIAAVRANMNQFSQSIDNAGVDVRIVLISRAIHTDIFGPLDENGICIGPPLGSGGCPGDTNLPKYAHMDVEVGSDNALQLILDQFDTWKVQLRPSSFKTFVVVSDADANMGAAAFDLAVDQLDPALIAEDLWRFSGVFAFSQCAAAEQAGTVYQELVTRTGGVAADLCQQQFQPVFDSLSQAVIASSKLDCSWTIPDPPEGESFAKDLVNVELTDDGGATTVIGKVPEGAKCGPEGGWVYDDETAPTRVEVCPATCNTVRQQDSGSVDIRFGCRTVEIPR